MYQVSWYDLEADEHSFAFVDEWSTLETMIMGLTENGYQVYASMVLSNDPDLPKGDMEKSMYFENILRLMPDGLSDEEVLATLMSVAYKYWDQQGFMKASQMFWRASKERWNEEFDAEAEKKSWIN